MRYVISHQSDSPARHQQGSRGVSNAENHGELELMLLPIANILANKFSSDCRHGDQIHVLNRFLSCSLHRKLFHDRPVRLMQNPAKEITFWNVGIGMSSNADPVDIIRLII